MRGSLREAKETNPPKTPVNCIFFYSCKIQPPRLNPQNAPLHVKLQNGVKLPTPEFLFPKWSTCRASTCTLHTPRLAFLLAAFFSFLPFSVPCPVHLPTFGSEWHFGHGNNLGIRLSQRGISLDRPTRGGLLRSIFDLPKTMFDVMMPLFFSLPLPLHRRSWMPSRPSRKPQDLTLGCSPSRATNPPPHVVMLGKAGPSQPGRNAIMPSCHNQRTASYMHQDCLLSRSRPPAYS
ncbi:hypothetical protein EDB81DRAFT_251918 [Dactylonectria macrodidyma]|uniref:Uncharacterized protein n=1 Tax=Dactylonectria macrodidyma TaxID=307937 RepID=A0A9P9FN06_9HYPO|nr:hypothetical protein EDB81DRAFT_251918 [Dactylonectria macrodidyma]